MKKSKKTSAPPPRYAWKRIAPVAFRVAAMKGLPGRPVESESNCPPVSATQAK